MAIEKDLDALRGLAVEIGAFSAQVIPAHEVVFDERAVLKCQYGCPSYGRLAASIGKIRELVEEVLYEESGGLQRGGVPAKDGTG